MQYYVTCLGSNFTIQLIISFQNSAFCAVSRPVDSSARLGEGGTDVEVKSKGGGFLHAEHLCL